MDIQDLSLSLSRIEINHLINQISIRDVIILKKSKNQVYLVDSNSDKKYILKLFSNTNRYRSEAGIFHSSLIESLGISPKCVLFVPPRMLVFEYLEKRVSLGGRMCPNFIMDGPFLNEPHAATRAIVTLLSQLQKLKEIVNEFRFLPETTLQPSKNDGLIARAKKCRPDQQLLLDNISFNLEKNYSAVSINRNDGVAHGDFRPHHVYVDKSFCNPMLIDWECATRSNINLDVATLLLTIQLSEFCGSEQLADNLLAELKKKMVIDPVLIRYFAMSLALSWVSQRHVSDKGFEFLSMVEEYDSHGSNHWFQL